MKKGKRGQIWVSILRFWPISQRKNVLLEQRGKGISGKGKSVDIGTVYKNGKGVGAETEGPCCQAKRFVFTSSKAT